MKTVSIRSAEGRLCIDPGTGRPLPPEGASVALNGYWRRRLADGDAVLVDPAPVSKPVSRKKGDDK